MKKIDMQGKRFGRLIVLKQNGIRHDEKCWDCQCDCGNIVNVTGSNLRRGNVQSCGCLKIERIKNANTIHGNADDSLYRRHKHMIWRCTNPKSKDFKNYGGRGIKVCDEWLGKDGFIHFKEWALSHGYSEELTIDRIDPNGDYEPNNCRWITLKEQQNNRRNNVFVNIDGVEKTIAEWSEFFNIPYNTFRNKIKQLQTF